MSKSLTILNNLFLKLDIEVPSNIQDVPFEIINYKKGQHFTQANQPCHQLGFILSGSFRKYYLSQEGKEFTTTFCQPGGFISPFTDQLKRQNSSIYIQALAKSEVAIFPFTDLQNFIKDLGHYDKVQNQILLSLLEEKEEREKALLLLNTRERIDWLENKIPEIYDITTKKVIASYLAIDPSTFSRHQ